MSAARNRQKQQNRSVHHSLLSAEQADNRKAIRQTQQHQHAKNLFAMANLVFGGIIIGGVFQDVSNPLLVYVLGAAAFAFLYLWGSILLKKSLK